MMYDSAVLISSHRSHPRRCTAQAAHIKRLPCFAVSNNSSSGHCPTRLTLTHQANRQHSQLSVASSAVI